MLRTIFGAVKIFYYVSKLFGFSCFELNFSLKRIQFRSISFAILFISISFWTLISWSSISHLKVKNSEDSKFTKTIFIASIYGIYSAFNPVLVIFVIIFHNLKRKNIGRFLRKINSFDVTLIKLRWKFQCVNQSFYALVVSIITFVLMSLKIRFVMEYLKTNHDDDWLSLISFGGSIFDVPILVIILSHFLMSSFCVLLRLQILCKNFRTLHLSGYAIPLTTEKCIFNNFTRLYTTFCVMRSIQFSQLRFVSWLVFF